MRLRLTGIAACALAMLQAGVALAQDTGDGVGGSGVAQLLSRLFFWVQAQEQWFSQNMTGALEKLAGGNPWNAALLLAGFSFIYGIFHAVGPGHGKAVISSYVLANERTLKRGVLIAFMAGFFQALSAIAIVSVMGLVFNLGKKRMEIVSNNLETISYAVIMLLGLWLLFRQVRGLFAARTAAHDHSHDHGHDHSHHDHSHDDHSHDDHDHHGHVHLPGAAELEGAFSFRTAIGMAAAVGLRPCTGALIVLVLALHQGMYWAGVISTFVMAFGTSITVSLLAVMAVTSRDLATRMAGTSEVWVGRIETFAKFGGGVVMLVFGLMFFLASLHPHPFQ